MKTTLPDRPDPQAPHPEPGPTAGDGESWDHGTHQNFYDYYRAESTSESTLQRFESIRDIALRVARHEERGAPALDVADVGCGAATQAILWARGGHRVHGLDVNEPLIDLARQRATEEGVELDLRVGTAIDLPWDDGCMDVCLVPELLEHVAEWVACLDEFTRILRPGGVLVLSTNNALCPKQQEFNLPLYSWYPGPLKRHYERLAFTTRPELANYAKYPAVNWFTFYGLRRELARRGFASYDRFDVMNLAQKGSAARLIVGAVRRLPPLRLLGHMATPYTLVAAVKSGEPAGF